MIVLNKIWSSSLIRIVWTVPQLSIMIMYNSAWSILYCQVTIWPRKHKRKTPSQAFTRSKQICRFGRSFRFCGTVHSSDIYSVFIILGTSNCFKWYAVTFSRWVWNCAITGTKTLRTIMYSLYYTLLDYISWILFEIIRKTGKS